MTRTQRGRRDPTSNHSNPPSNQSPPPHAPATTPKTTTPPPTTADSTQTETTSPPPPPNPEQYPNTPTDPHLIGKPKIPPRNRRPIRPHRQRINHKLHRLRPISIHHQPTIPHRRQLPHHIRHQLQRKPIHIRHPHP